ncbi:MAG TPA: hypothetical protein VJB68_03430 [Methylophilaceae bacterium]|nr:hypothetical protein [Methylophilaceae bacterium]
MNKIRLVFLALILMLAGTSSAYARDSFGFSINLGAPGYYAAPPVYYSAPPVVYYSPAPVYYQSYGPSVYYRPYYEPRHHYYDRGHHRGWDDHRGGHHR